MVGQSWEFDAGGNWKRTRRFQETGFPGPREPCPVAWVESRIVPGAAAGEPREMVGAARRYVQHVQSPLVPPLWPAAAERPCREPGSWPAVSAEVDHAVGTRRCGLLFGEEAWRVDKLRQCASE